MEHELTLGDIFEYIAEQLAQARTQSLMGEYQAAQSAYRVASSEFQRYQELLHGFPGYYALENALIVTQEALCEEQDMVLSPPSPPARTVLSRPRRRTRKAA